MVDKYLYTDKIYSSKSRNISYIVLNYLHFFSNTSRPAWCSLQNTDTFVVTVQQTDTRDGERIRIHTQGLCKECISLFP